MPERFLLHAVSPEAADRDGDGMPDWWEDLQSLDPVDPSDAALDPDGDGLRYEWWFQVFPDDGMPITIEDPTASKIQFKPSSDDSGRQFHLICEVHDDGPFSLVSYRRIIITVD